MATTDTIRMGGIAEEQPRMLGSLFPSDTGLLSNEAVTQILDGLIEPKAKGRLGVLPLGAWNFGDAGSAGSQFDLLSTRIPESPLIGEVVRIPRLLLPDRLTVPSVREVAARLRCEHVLLYHITINNRYRHRTFTRDRSRARITIEAVVLHTRTGIIPCSFVVDHDLDVEQGKGEESWELWERAQIEAIHTALGKIGDQVVERLR